jgi:DmsE family decaheme c-type cytochrome
MMFRRILPFCLAALLLALAPGAAPGPAAQEKPADKPADKPPSASSRTDHPAGGGRYAEPGICATCHADQAASIVHTAHGRTAKKSWDGAASCESCHGPGAAHVEAGGGKGTILNLRELAPEESSALCLDCHEQGERSRWKGSHHEQRDLTCITCHKIHHEGQVPANLLHKDEFATCGACHLKRKASLMRSSHMPLREGSMNCSSCHDPHGTTNPAMLKQFSVNENCYACHAEKRSPVLWEHPPVREDCTTCHDPHGSLHPRLLVAKQPRLCQQCHDELRHPTQPYASASIGPGFFPNSRMFDRGCVNCHSMVHGSNHPAGMRFLR